MNIKQAFHITPNESDKFEVCLVKENTPGFFQIDPKSEFYFIGSESDASKKAEWLNKEILKLDSKEVIRIVFSSMAIL